MKKDIVVLGLGNPLMSDEGIGVFLIEKLAASADRPEPRRALIGAAERFRLHRLIPSRRPGHE